MPASFRQLYCAAAFIPLNIVIVADVTSAASDVAGKVVLANLDRYPFDRAPANCRGLTTGAAHSSSSPAGTRLLAPARIDALGDAMPSIRAECKRSCEKSVPAAETRGSARD